MAETNSGKVVAGGIFVGLDVGTQGAKAAVMSGDGRMLASASSPFGGPLQHEEQSPARWWSAASGCLQRVAAALREQGLLGRIMAISATSTSGTVIPLGAGMEPVCDALMYSDKRAAGHVGRCREAARSEGLDAEGINVSYGLPKIVWFCEARPELAGQVKQWCHATDYLLGKLSGEWGVTDYTNALKTGYNLDRMAWPAYLQERLQLPAQWFPRVCAPGEQIGVLARQAAAETGLPAGIAVIAGMTDGCASQVAAGATGISDWNSTIGTTLVVKGVTRKKLADPDGSVYNHRHPDGLWMPGGASNTGAGWISEEFPGEVLTALNQRARGAMPSGLLRYPLMQQGERFPFVHGQASGFAAAAPSPEHAYVAGLEGVAYLERMAYDRMELLGAEPASRILTTGGGSYSELWMAIRSNVLGKPVHRPLYPEGAAGAAVIAAAGSLFGSMAEAAGNMIRIDATLEPGQLVGYYEEQYGRFVRLLQQKGYLAEGWGDKV